MSRKTTLRGASLLTSIGIAALTAGSMAGQPAMAEPMPIGAVIQRDYRGATAEHREVAEHAIYFNNAVHANETIATGYNGATRLELLDRSQVAVGANSRLTLDEFVYDADSLTSSGQMRFMLGAFRYVGGESKHKEGLTLETPTATITIRGTELVIFVTPTGRSEINVIEGAISVTACGGGGSADLGAGESVTIDPLCRLSVDRARPLPHRFIPKMPPDFGGSEREREASNGDDRDDHAKEGMGEGNGSRGDVSDGDDRPKDGGSNSGGGKPKGGGTKGTGGGKPKGGDSTGGGATGGGSTGGGSTGGGSTDGGSTDGGADSGSGDNGSGGSTGGDTGTGGGLLG